MPANYPVVLDPIGFTPQTGIWQKFFNTWVGVLLTKLTFRSNTTPTAL
jgi:hypothetical protein